MLPSISNCYWWYYFPGYEWNHWSTVLCVFFWSKPWMARFVINNSVILNLLFWNETLFSVKLNQKEDQTQVPLFYTIWTCWDQKIPICVDLFCIIINNSSFQSLYNCIYLLQQRRFKFGFLDCVQYDMHFVVWGFF